MEREQVISEANCSVSETVQQPEIAIDDNNACKTKDATMEIVENISTANSTIEISKINDNSTDKKGEFENIEANICSAKTVEVQQSESIIHENVSSETKNVMITDDEGFGATMESNMEATMEIVDSIVTESNNVPTKISKNEDNETENNEELTNTKSVPIFTEGVEKNVDLQIPNHQNLEKCEDDLDEMQGDENTAEKTVTSLSSIALAYDNSDSESEQVESTEKNNESASKNNEMEIQITKEYRTVNVSSDEDSDSSSSSSSSSDSSSDEESDDSDQAEKNVEKNVTKKKNERNNSRFSASHEKESKGEFDDLPPIEDLKISVPEVLCDPLGEVAWMVEQMVVVRPKPGKPTLNLDTILFVERGRRVLGRIFDVFGQVSDPHYCVRFNSTEHIKESDIKVGMIAYFCPNTEYTSVVFLQDLLKMKATDELGDDEHPEFSDDEEERAYYAALKQKQKSEKAKTAEEVPQKRQRTGKDPGWKSNHPWSSGRKQDQSKKPEENYNSPGRPGNTQRNPRNQANLWQQQQQQQQYPSAYPNISWPPAAESYQDNTWPPQNPYGYSEPFDNRHQPGNSRPFFRPPHSFQTGPVPYMPNAPFAQQTNRCRFPGMNFPWQSPVPRQPNLSWRFSSPPPPPPPPPPGM